MIELIQMFIGYIILAIGGFVVLLEFAGFFESSEEPTYSLTEIDDLEDFENSLSEPSQERLRQEIKKYKQE